MTVSSLIKVKLAERGFSQAYLAELAGFKNQSNVSMFLRSDSNMKVNNLMTLLDALDCELIVKDKSTGEEKSLSYE